MSAITESAHPALAPLRAQSGRRRVLAVKLFLVCALIVVFASCTGRQAVPTGYGKAGSSVEKHFIEGCVSEAPGSTAKSSTSVCTCAFAEVKKTIPFADFKKVNSELSKKPGPLPETFATIIVGCASTG